MGKKQLKVLALLIVAVLAFTIIVFVIPFHRGASFWIAYIAVLLALALQIPIFKLAYDNADDLRSKVLGFPIFRAGYLYLGIQTAVSVVIFILGAFIPAFPAWIAAVLCVIILAAAIICSISADMARNEVVDIETAQAADTKIIMELRTRARNLVSRIKNFEIKTEMEKLAEDLRYSDPVSSDATAEAEQRLSECFTHLETAVVGDDIENALELCRQAVILLRDRNNICKMNK